MSEVAASHSAIQGPIPSTFNWDSLYASDLSDVAMPGNFGAVGFGVVKLTPHQPDHTSTQPKLATLYAGDLELWQDMNRRKPAKSSSSSSGSSSGSTSSSSGSGGSSSGGGLIATPWGKVGSFDEDEVAALLRSEGEDSLLAEDNGHGGSLVEDLIMQGDHGTLFDASFFSKFSANLTPESVFGIDGTGAGIGVGAGLTQDALSQLPQRKRKGHRRTNSGSSELLGPLSALMSARPATSSAGTSKEGSDEDEEPEHPFAFYHDDREDKMKRHSRGRYKCSRCGVSKTGHTCSVLEDVEMTVTRATQVETRPVSQALLAVICAGGNGETADGDRVLTVSPRSKA